MSKICPRCGANVENEVALCPQCGLNLATQQAPNPQYQQPNPQYQQGGQQYYQQPNPQYQQPNPQYQQPNPQYQQPNPQYQQPNPQYQQGGQQYYQQPNPQYQQQGGQYYQSAPQPQKPAFKMPDFKKLWNDPKIRNYCIIGAVALVAIIAIIVAVVLLTPPSPEAVAKNFVNDVIKGNSEAAVNALLPTNWGFDEEKKEDLIDQFEVTADRIEGNYDKVSVSVLRVKDFDEEEIEMYRDYTLSYFENRYAEFNMDDITDYKRVKLKMTVVEDGDRDSTTMELILVKYKGKWKIVNPELL